VFATLLMPGAGREQTAWWTELQRVSTTPHNALRIERTSYDIDVTTLATEVRAPALVLHARDDAMIPFEQGRELAALIPHARLVPLESRNHVLLAEEPAWPRFLAAVREFLGTADGTGTRPDPLPQLSRRERAVLDAIASGASNDEVAARLSISTKTVGNHITRIFRKLGVRHRPEAIVRAREHGLGRGGATE
jgi:DNA-binding NarL/FixJ family response regulator